MSNRREVSKSDDILCFSANIETCISNFFIYTESHQTITFVLLFESVWVNSAKKKRVWTV